MFADAPVATIIFLFTIGISLYGLFSNQSLLYAWMLHPSEVVYEKKWYQVLTSGFIHGDLGHLIFNMMTFYFFAFRLEMYMGSLGFVLIYFLSMILSDIPTIIQEKDNPDYASLGASGAIAGVLFSYILFDPTTKIYIFFIPIGIPAAIFAVLYLVYSYYAARGHYDNVNHSAHLWGALTGLVLTLLMEPSTGMDFLESFRNVFGM